MPEGCRKLEADQLTLQESIRSSADLFTGGGEGLKHKNPIDLPRNSSEESFTLHSLILVHFKQPTWALQKPLIVPIYSWSHQWHTELIQIQSPICMSNPIYTHRENLK